LLIIAVALYPELFAGIRVYCNPLDVPIVPPDRDLLFDVGVGYRLFVPPPPLYK
jgi:hypothetical protein